MTAEEFKAWRKQMENPEVAALMVVPLGVARVLIADMAGMGLVTVHGGASKDNETPDLALLERVLSGLRRL
jgi:hypothetical protein